MILKTQEFKNVCKTILLAVNDQAANLQLESKDNYLYLEVTNKEYYVATKFQLESPEAFIATVDAALFLTLISGITTETFELSVKDNTVVIKVGRSSYKLPIIYENDSIMTLPVIAVHNKTVEMSISNEILKSILNVNSKELVKIRNLDVSELQKLYYIDETGCFTFTTGATVNAFTLDKPVQMLLNDRIVKLFKLFDTDVEFSLGHETLSDNSIQTRISMKTDNTYLAAIITNDDILLQKVKGPCTATKNFIKESYLNKLVLSANSLNAAISRLMLFTKNSIEKANMLSIPATISFTNNELTITDKLGNTEVVVVENGSYVDTEYSMILNLADLKLVLDSCKDEHITLNCGNHKSVVITHAAISNLLPEGVQA